ncbi:MAG: LysR family transcriptional regulator [Roseibium sp.]
MRLRFRQLQALHAVIETGTVTGAAEQLGISQPGVSNLLSQLEMQTGFKLFERVHGRMIPTPEADLLNREVDTVVRGLDHVTQTVIDLQNKQFGHLQVASQHSASFGFMPKLIARFAKDRPELNISFQAQTSSKIQEWVMSGLFEIGFCELPLLYDSLTAYPVYIETVVALPDSSCLKEHRILTPDLLADQPIVAMGPDHMSHRRLREAFHNAGIPLKARVHSHLFKNLLSFVKEGMGAAILDRFATDFDFEGSFVVRPFRPAIFMDMAVITSKTRPLSQVGQDFLELLLEELEQFTIDDTSTNKPD